MKVKQIVDRDPQSYLNQEFEMNYLLKRNLRNLRFEMISWQGPPFLSESWCEMNCFVTRSPIPIWIWNLKWIACLLAPIPLWIWDFKYIICWQGPPFLSESECEMNCLLTGSPVPHWIWNVKWMVCWQGPCSNLIPKFEMNLSVDKDHHSYLYMKVDRVFIWILK